VIGVTRGKPAAHSCMKARKAESSGFRRPTTRWSRPGQPGVEFGAILALAGRAAHLEAVRQRRAKLLRNDRPLGSPRE